MTKQISQDTFDDVVKENVEEFDMSGQEAIEDAISQFEAQGVDLSNIVKDLSLSSGDSQTQTKHPIIEALDLLTQALTADPISHNEVQNLCERIMIECDKDLAHRCLAGKNAAYPTLLRVAQICKDDMKTLLSCLSTFCSLCNGQPDLLENVGLRLFIEIASGSGDHNDICMYAVRLIKLTCIKHEDNRQNYVSNGIISALINILEDNKDKANIVKEVCGALRVLTFDDDVRVPFGKAHDHAKLIVTETGALGKIINIAQNYIEDQVILGELFTTLARLAVRNEFCQEIMELGGVKLILDSLAQHSDNQSIVRQIFTVLKAVAGNDQVKIGIIKANGASLILDATARHIKQPSVCEMSCAAIGAIVLRNESHCNEVMDKGGAEVIVKVMQVHPGEAAVQKQACMAVRNLVARTRHFTTQFLELGVEDLIRNILANHSTSCKDEAQASLRDLGCKVELVERWTGQGTGIRA